MKANKKTLMTVKFFLENEQEYWDKDEMISEIVAETSLLKHKSMGESTIATDECAVEWGGYDICNLDDFVITFADKFLEKITNILESFVGENISCYFEEN